MSLFFALVALASIRELVDSQFACQQDSCAHGVCKPFANDSYECFCENGYTGYHCETNYDDCVSFPCLNEASCIDIVAGVKCICPQGYTGEFCESLLDHCSSHPCLNGGTCYDFPDGFNCSCGTGFDGQNCEVDIEVCNLLDSEQIQCFNGGTCIEGVGISFTCSCVSGFEGPRCETNIDECLSQPCQNNGTCVDELAGFICICSYRWTGIFCELEQEICDPEFCSNMGLCVGNTTQHLCYCIPDYHGPNCQWRYDECLPKPRCFHGGTCMDGVDEFTCSCLPEFIGKRCEVHCHNNCSADDGGSSSAFPSNYDPSMVNSYWPTESVSTLESQFLPEEFISSHDDDFNTPTMMNSAAQTSDPNSCISGSSCSYSWKDDSYQPGLPSPVLFSSYSGFSMSPSESFKECTTLLEITTALDPATSPLWSSWDMDYISPSFLSQDMELTEWPFSPSAEESNWLTSPSWPGHSHLTMTPLLSTSWWEPEEVPSDGMLSSPQLPAWWPSARSPVWSLQFSPSLSENIFVESTGLGLSNDPSDDYATAQTSSPNSHWATLPFAPSDIGTDQYDPVSFLWTSSATDEISRFYLISEDLMRPEIQSVSIIDWHSRLTSSIFLGSVTAMFTPVPVPSMPFFTPIRVSSAVMQTETVLLPSYAIHSRTPVPSSTPLSPTLISIVTPVPPYDTEHYPCTSNTCQNNGICQSSAADLPTFKCHCRLLFAGPYCERQLDFIGIPSFDGSSHLIHNLRNATNGTGDFVIQVTFETIAENGVIFYIDFSPDECLDTFVMMEIENGLALLGFSCGSHSVVSMEEGLRVDDGAQHTVAVGMQWYRNALGQVICNVSMQLDQWPPLTGQQHDVPLLCNVAHLHLGGVHPLAPEVNNDLHGKIGFTGCVINASVNGQALHLVSGAVDGLNVQECNSVLCASGICHHGASCHNVSKTEIECECPVGFAGQFCELHRCPDGFCQSGGTCLPSIERSGQRHNVCLCPLGFEGLHCEQAQNRSMEEISFSGSTLGYASFISIPLPVPAINLTVRINFVPEESSRSELLLFLGQTGQHFRESSFLAVGIKDDSVILQYNLGTGTDLLKYDGSIRSDGKHHLFTIGFNESRVWMTIDNYVDSTISAVVTDQFKGLGQFKTQIYIGGHAAYNFTTLPENLLFSSGFKGCITDIHINDIRVNSLLMEDETVVGRNVHQCQKRKCDISCKNGGTCVSTGTASMCLCPAGWTGPLCNDPSDPCHSGTHHCSPNSDCISEGQGYRCDCSLGWTGDRCDQGLNFSTPYFNGVNSYMAFLPRNIRHQLILRVQFQPLNPNGLLFYAAVQLKDGSSDFVCLALDEGFVEFRYNLGGGRYSTAVLRSRNKFGSLDPSWHTVDVWQRGGKATLALDGQNVTGQAISGMVTLDTATKFYLGGLPDMELIAKDALEKTPMPFHGCIRHFEINSLSYSLSAQGSERPASGRNIGNCSGSATGFFNKCANGGTCVSETPDNCQCVCVQPFTGPNCLDVLPCHFHICQNGGTCVPIGSTDSQLQYGVPYTCDCPLGWMGQYCELQISQITEARFGGHGYVLVVDDSYALSDRTRNRIALNFSTAVGSGLLLWTGVEPNFDDDYLAVGLEYGRLKVAWNLGWFSRSQLIMPLDSNGDTLADSKWHTVVLYRQKQKISIKLDDVIISANTPGSFTELNTLGVYYIGGLPHGVNFTSWTNGHFHAGFVGCLKTVEISESKQAVDFMGAVSGSNILQC